MTQQKSIIRQVNRSSSMLVIILMIPALVSLLIMLVFASKYQESVSRMGTIAQLKPMVDNDIAEELWSTVSGRKSFEECGVYDTINMINRTLEEQITGTAAVNHLELTVARRTMDTLLGYVQQIETNMINDVPIAKSEATLEEVRNVASLVKSMLEDAITQEISHIDNILKTLRSVALICVVVDVFILLMAILLTRHMIGRTKRNISEPIEHLEHFAGLLADGHLHTRIPHTDVEELVTLTDRVNVMANNLEALIEQNRIEQENLKKSELRLLQAQINPHFLYNTLDAIVWMAESGQSESVVNITRALSDFFRISLSSGADWIPVSQEIKHLMGYLSIQKTRYRDILNYQLEIDDDIGDIYVLKLLLQPLVENALYHGIKNKRGGGVITVCIRQRDDRLYFSVSDTGCGMSAERLEELRRSICGEHHVVHVPTDGGSGFGLGNVDQRIRLYYGQDDGLHITSGPEGTTVAFHVPCKTKEESERD